MNEIRLLFLGASRLVGHLERFRSAADALGVALVMYSFEDDKPWHPVAVAGLAKTIAAPRFEDPSFPDFLLSFSRAHSVDIVIPDIDRATVALASLADEVRGAGALPIVSSRTVCEAMADKAMADGVFRSLDLPVPPRAGFPLLAKPRFGSSSRGIIELKDQTDLDHWLSRVDASDYLLQKKVCGTEYSVDAYVDASGRIIGAVSRVREAVSGGEVMITRTSREERVLSIVEKLLSWDRWFGPVTVQIISDGTEAWIIESNPRFGSGATCSMEAGLAAPEWILRERLGMPLPQERIQWRDGLCMTRSRQDHFLWLS